MRTLCLIIALLTFAAPYAIAVEPDEVLSDAALEARARALSKELRCMVCQNQSIDDSEAPLARDLRIIVRERLQAGDSDRQVIDFLVARYGEFVLLSRGFMAHRSVVGWCSVDAAQWRMRGARARTPLSRQLRCHSGRAAGAHGGGNRAALGNLARR
jgi:cytochrome c-type biogenesis protein CcmH/NrfF